MVLFISSNVKGIAAVTAIGKGDWQERLERAIGKSDWKERLEKPVLFPLAFSTRCFHSPFPLAVSTRSFQSPFRFNAREKISA
jgi:hypothetical protein